MKLRFGRYVGWQLASVPHPYLKWLRRQQGVSTELREEIGLVLGIQPRRRRQGRYSTSRWGRRVTSEGQRPKGCSGVRTHQPRVREIVIEDPQQYGPAMVDWARLVLAKENVGELPESRHEAANANSG